MEVADDGRESEEVDQESEPSVRALAISPSFLTSIVGTHARPAGHQRGRVGGFEGGTGIKFECALASSAVRWPSSLASRRVDHGMPRPDGEQLFDATERA